MRKLLAVALTALGLGLGPASANFVVSGGVAGSTVGNDFLATLSAHGLTAFRNSLAGLSVDGAGTITIYAFANESDLHTAFLRDGAQKAFENNSGSGLHFFDPAGDHFPGTQVDQFAVLPGDAFCGGCAHNFGFIVTGGGLGGTNAGVGDAGFGVYYNPNDLSMIALAFDDGQPIDDDNHDDLIVIARFAGAVPEPASWTLMIAAFAALGLRARRRRRTAA